MSKLLNSEAASPSAIAEAGDPLGREQGEIGISVHNTAYGLCQCEARIGPMQVVVDVE